MFLRSLFSLAYSIGSFSPFLDLFSSTLCVPTKIYSPRPCYVADPTRSAASLRDSPTHESHLHSLPHLTTTLAPYPAPVSAPGLGRHIKTPSLAFIVIYTSLDFVFIIKALRRPLHSFCTPWILPFQVPAATVSSRDGFPQRTADSSNRHSLLVDSSDDLISNR